MPESSAEEREGRLKNDTENIIRQFFQGVPYSLARHREFSPAPPRLTIADESKYSEESLACIVRIRSAIETYRDDLMRQAAADILTYLTRYSVGSKSGDPLKLAYWFGLALAAKVGQHNELDRKVVLTLTVWILDIFCFWHCEKTLPEDMRSKLDMSISQAENKNDFGGYGIYFSFKVLSKLG